MASGCTRGGQVGSREKGCDAVAQLPVGVVESPGGVQEPWRCGTDGHGLEGMVSRVGFGDLNGLFQPLRFYDPSPAGTLPHRDGHGLRAAAHAAWRQGWG